ncbi:dTMP kinase [Helicobacter himalayensis]|uniref:dTMP kinase n=1 Tax=Helicobacter himalayensis TaxID=1591088 RepID=UPI003D6EFE57
MDFQTSDSGFYVTLEGIDTSGKSTQIKNLANYYPHAVFSREPGGTSLGEKVRNIVLNDKLDVMSELFLFLSDRAQHYSEVLEPNLEAHKLIITDRSLISNMAYAKNLSDTQLLECNHIATRGLKPHLCILFYLDEENLKARLGDKASDSIEKRGVSYMLEIQKRLEFYANLLEVRTIKIDATLPIPMITKNITSHIDMLIS